MDKFKIGDKVRLDPKSEYYGQFKGVGEIVRMNQEDDDNLVYIVKCGKYINSYGDIDLMLSCNKMEKLKKELMEEKDGTK